MARRCALKRMGLSPHARGNPQAPTAGSDVTRSIPARAGQPAVATTANSTSAVYPRTRGATATTVMIARMIGGLSPHARGNPVRLDVRRAEIGSIPARAGQPPMRNCTPVSDRVYPRTRGATPRWPRGRSRSFGLSPHARGNPPPPPPAASALRSIPARAGQPDRIERTEHVPTVYPRTRGATSARRLCSSCVRGLSPHARGNLLHALGYPCLSRSIPARAGQPAPRCRSPAP